MRFTPGVPSGDVDQESGEMLPECLEYNKRFNQAWAGYEGGDAQDDDEQVVANYHAFKAEQAEQAEQAEGEAEGEGEGEQNANPVQDAPVGEPEQPAERSRRRKAEVVPDAPVEQPEQPVVASEPVEQPVEQVSE